MEKFTLMESLSLELLYRIVHSANQLCVNGAVTNRCETLERTESEKRENSGQELNQRLLKNQNFNTEEISSLVKILRAPPASWNRMHQKAQSFGLLKEQDLSSSGEGQVSTDSS